MASNIDVLARRFRRRPRKQVLSHFKRIETAPITQPPGTLFDQLDFIDHVERVLERIRKESDLRLMVLEAWLLVDYVVTYMLRDGLSLPENLDNALRVLPSSFDRKVAMLQRLIKVESAKLVPNEDSYRSFRAHPAFMKALREDHGELFNQLIQLGARFESDRGPKPHIVDIPRYSVGRFVPEWWFRKSSRLTPQWFEACRALNDARNSAAHHMTLKPKSLYGKFNVEGKKGFRSALLRLIKTVVYRSPSQTST